MKGAYNKHPRVFSKRIVLCVAMLLCFDRAVAQTTTDAVGDNVVKVGGGVSPPVPLDSPEPYYSKEAQHAKYQGICVLVLVVGTDGRTHDIKVSRSLGLGLDEKAVEAVKQWRFKPGMKDGKPVAVQISVQINFHLYGGPLAKPNSLPTPEQNEFEVDSPPHVTQEQMAKLAVEWSTKPAYSQEQLAGLRMKCAPYVGKNFEDLQVKRVALPPHECAGVLAWMRTLEVEGLYVTAKPPQ